MFGFFKRKPPGPRLDYTESCRRLQPRHLDHGEFPRLPDRMPQPGDDAPAVSFFRTRLEDDDLSSLTLPRTFFGRSEISRSSLRNTDLSESNLCWNDVEDVDFTDAVLARSDLRASRFTGVRFDGADLSGADLRQSTFERCTFTRATMAGVVLTPAQGRGLSLSAAQRSQIAWTDDEGDEPPGG